MGVTRRRGRPPGEYAATHNMDRKGCRVCGFSRSVIHRKKFRCGESGDIKQRKKKDKPLFGPECDYCLTPYGKSMVESVMGLVGRIAESFAVSVRADREEMVSLANLLTIRMASGFRPDIPFSAYVACYLKKALISYVHRGPLNRFHSNMAQLDTESYREPADPRMDHAQEFEIREEFEAYLSLCNHNVDYLKDHIIMNMNLIEISAKHGISRDAAQKRVSRAIESIRINAGIQPGVN